MKRFLCALLTLLIILGCSPVLAAHASEEPPMLIMPAPGGESGEISWDKLVEDFISENGINPDTVAMGYYNTVTGEEHYYRGTEQMTAASVNKVPLNMYYAEKLFNGEISWDTPYGGLPYKQAQELSLRYSNNDYTNAMIDSIGDYPVYRRAICPYIGVDPDEKEHAFFTVNEFTTEQIMYALKLLHADPERYPGVKDNMLLANPGEYFEQTVSDYEIAQKYGWFVIDGHNCINCVGIVETPEPILLAIFTDNCSMGKDILGEYCAMMCAYTEDSIALRAQAEAERLAAEAEAERLAAEEEAARAAEEEAAKAAEEERLAAEKEAAERAKAAKREQEKEEEMYTTENTLRVVVCILACAMLAIALGIVSRHSKKPADTKERTGVIRNILSVLIGACAIVAIIATVKVVSYGLEAKPVIMDESSAPEAVAEQFMEHVLSGESAEAEKLLLGSGKLGLDSVPEDALGSMLYSALQESFSYEKLGECTEDSIDASQSFTVTYLDIPSITALQQEATNARLAQYLEAAERAEEVQAADGSYLPEVAMHALEEVTGELLLNAEDHYVSTELTIRLQYSAGEWKVIADEDLFAILSGNTAY